MDAAFGVEHVLSRAELKTYVKRNDASGLLYLAGHFALIAATGYGVFLAIDTYFLVPAMFAHGVVIAFLFAPMHETSHGTAFRTRWLNEAVFRLISLIYISPPVFFRYFHAAHHTYTQIRGKDPDIVMPPQPTWVNYVIYISTFRLWRRNMTWFFTHAFGRMDPRDSWYVPKDEWPRVYREARVMIAFYAALAFGAYWTGTGAEVLTYWLIPRLMGEPVMRWIRVTEHTGCEEGPDLRRNTRTTKSNPFFRALFWNMPYHAEHHLCPAVPFHALRRMHENIGDQLHPVGESYTKVHRYVIDNVLVSRAAKRAKQQEGAA
jgi:fatty acid desaturase